MSSPIHQAEELDPALRYAPRWARDRVVQMAAQPLAPPVLARKARPEFSGDRAMLELQRQLVLDPDTIPEPIADDARVLGPIALRLSAVIGLAALIAWGVVSLPGMRKAGEIMSPDAKAPAIAVNPVKLVQVQATDSAPQAGEGFVAMNDPAPPAPPVPPVNLPIHALVPTLPVEPSRVTPPPSQAAPSPVALAPSNAEPTPSQAGPARWNAEPTPSQAAPALSNAGPTSSQPSPAPSHPAPAPSQADDTVATLHLDGAEIAATVKRGKDLFMTGDIVSARLLLRRAAAAGSAEAALALGATFDPLVIQRIGAIGMPADIAQARQWYKRAADLGSAAATGQLAKLEQAH